MIAKLRAGKGPGGSGIEQFLRWWGAELWGLVPERLRRALRPGRDRLVLAVEGDEVAAFHETAEGHRALGRFALGGGAAISLAGDSQLKDAEVAVRLPRERALRKVLTLPAVAEENLYQVLGFEMDRQTPFKADQVYYDGRVRERLAATGQIRVALTLVPRAALDPLLARFGEWGLHPEVVYAGDGDGGEDSGVNLLPGDRRRAGNRGLRRLNAAIAILALALAGATLLSPLLQKRAVVVDLLARVDTVAKEAHSVGKLKERVERLEAESNFLMDKKRSAPVAFQVITELSKVIPDDTWLGNLSVRSTAVQIQGQSPAASQLIEAIEASALFHNTRFASPVTKQPQSSLERFQITTEVVTGTAP